MPVKKRHVPSPGTAPLNKAQYKLVILYILKAVEHTMWNPFRPPPPLHMSESFQYIYIYKKLAKGDYLSGFVGPGGGDVIPKYIYKEFNKCDV
jgi:hypothetical protein